DRTAAAGPAVQALSLGNSHGRALDFEVLGLRAGDIRSSGGDHYESLHIARAVRPHLPHPERRFVTVEMFVSDNSPEIPRQEVRKQAYVITGDYTPLSGDRDVAFAARLAPIIRTDNWEGVVAKVARQLTGGGREARRRRGRPAPARTAEEIRESAGSRAALHRTWQQHSLDANPALCEGARAALRELVRVSAPARVVFYTPPYPPAYLRHFEEPVGCRLDRFAEELSAASPRVLYF